MMKIGLKTRFKIVGVEVVGLGIFLLIEVALSLRPNTVTNVPLSFSWDYAIIGALLIAVGLEILSLIKHVPARKRTQEEAEQS